MLTDTPAYTFYNTRTRDNFSIQNRDIDSMLNDIARWELLNNQTVLDHIIKGWDLPDGVRLRDWIYLKPEWEIILHRGTYRQMLFITRR